VTGTGLEQALRELTEKEIQSIWDDMLDKDKYGKDCDRLEELVGDRIKALDSEYTDREGRNKDRLEEIKEKWKESLKFRADPWPFGGSGPTDPEAEGFLEVAGKEEEFDDDFIYSYQNKGFDGRKAAKVYLEGWTNPKEINSSGYVSLETIESRRIYSFLALINTRQEAQEKVNQAERLYDLIYNPEVKDDLKELKKHLKGLEEFTSQSEPADGQPLTPTRYAYYDDQNRKNLFLTKTMS